MKLLLCLQKKINIDVDVELMKSELQQNLLTFEITIKGRNVCFSSTVEEFEAEYPLSFLWNCTSWICCMICLTYRQLSQIKIAIDFLGNVRI